MNYFFGLKSFEYESNLTIPKFSNYKYLNNKDIKLYCGIKTLENKKNLNE